MANKDLGVGLHLKIADTGASVSSNADELVIENTSDAGLSILTANDAGGYVKFGDPQDDNAGEIAYTHDDNAFTFTSTGPINFKTGGSGIDLAISSIGTLNSITTDTNGHQFTGNYTSGVNTLFHFKDGQGQTCGHIDIDAGSNSCSYNTSSDYRLKNNIENLTNGIDKIKQLKTYRFNWISNPKGNKVDGFIAHEVQDIVPEAISGEKDGEEMQGIDQSKLVPLITAALQEAITKIESLESEIDQLKGVN